MLLCRTRLVNDTLNLGGTAENFAPYRAKCFAFFIFSDVVGWIAFEPVLR